MRVNNLGALSCYAEPGVTLPEALAEQLNWQAPSVGEPVFWNKSFTQHTSIINSTDSDTTAEIIARNEADLLVIDVSELKPSDLLEHFIPQSVEGALSFRFNKAPSLLKDALANNKKILLKGYFSEALTDALMPLILQRQSDPNTLGRLYLLPENAELFRR